MKNEGKLFLIVDDEPDMCWALERILHKQGYLTETVFNAEGALSIIKPNRFRMAFLDAKLPDIEGMDLARRIRKVDPFMCVVMISGYFYSDDEMIHKALEENLISGFISKPFCNDKILKLIERLARITIT